MAVRRFGGWLALGLIPLVLASAGTALPASAQIRLIESQGEVQLKRRFWFQFRPVEAVQTLHLGDVLRNLGGRATILCENSTPYRLPDGISSVSTYCSPQTSPIAFGGLRGDRASASLAPIPGGRDDSIPYIISPRRSWLLDDEPTIRWNPVAGAESYTVQLVGPDVTWSATVAETEVIYPGEPALSSGETYLVIVTADTGPSSVDDPIDGLWEYLGDDSAFLYETDLGSGVGFSVLPSDLAAAVNRELEQLDTQDLTESAAAMSRVNVYIQNDLFAEAIATLEAEVEAGTELIAIYQTLGELYAHTGLSLMAQDAYLRAIERAVAQEDLEYQVLAQAELAKIYVNLGNEQQARNWLDLATSGYSELEPSQLQIEIAERIGRTYRALDNVDGEQVWLSRALDGYEALLADMQRTGEDADLTAEVDRVLNQIDRLNVRLSELTPSAASNDEFLN
jgi:hypothetical protein